MGFGPVRKTSSAALSSDGAILGSRRNRPEFRPRRLLDLQPIADARFVHEVPRPGWIALELVPQLTHVHAEILGVIDVRRSPNLLEQVTMGDDATCEPDEDGEQPVLRR